MEVAETNAELHIQYSSMKQHAWTDSERRMKVVSGSFPPICAELDVEPFVQETEENGEIRQLTQLEAMLCAMIGHSVRLRALLSALADQVLRKQENALVFVQLTASSRSCCAGLLDAFGPISGDARPTEENSSTDPPASSARKPRMSKLAGMIWDIAYIADMWGALLDWRLERS